MEKLGEGWRYECMHACVSSLEMGHCFFFFCSVLVFYLRAYQDGVLPGDDAVNCFAGLHIIARVAICVLLSAMMIPPYMSR